MLLNVGDKAPDFTLPDANGNDVSLKDYSGRKLVLWFFPKANTPGWITEGKGFRDESKSYKDNNIAIIGVSADSPKKQKKFVEKFQFQFPMLCDESHEMLEDYGIWGLKKFMGREYMGINRVTYLIDENGLIEKVYGKVKVKTHAIDILGEL